MTHAKKPLDGTAAVAIDRTRPAKAKAPEPGSRPRAVEAPRPKGATSLPTKPPVGAAPAGRAAAGKSSRVKAPLDDRVLAAARREAGRASMAPLDDQRPRRPGRPDAEASAAPAQYVRLQVRVAGDRLRVVDSHLVDGPLAPPSALQGAGAYEVSIGERLIHAAALPDIGIQRSFVDPSDHPQKQGHFITPRETYDIHVRIPAHELTRRSLADIRLTLHRLKSPAHGLALDARRLGAQLEQQVRPVAELVGLPASVLPAAIEKRGARTPRL